MPASLIATELVFFVFLVRMATREQIIPKTVQTTVLFPELDRYIDFWGIKPTLTHVNGITFTAEDAQQPFLTANDGMWDIFEPTLRQRTANLQQKSSCRDRVRACLTETLAGGQFSINNVAKCLAISPRTLQRHLRKENTNFQQELNKLREELATFYLQRPEYSIAEITFLLGYNEPSSFFRAFHTWTGKTPEAVRSMSQLSE